MQTIGEERFLDAYNRLNPQQKRAVDTIDGPVMVIAGPGTGKTQILTLRIANILRQTDTQPENILALTFTKSGVNAMRERLMTFMGSVAYRVPIFTFHGLCERLLRQYPEAYERIIGGTIASDIERIDVIELILEAKEVSILRPKGAPQFYIKSLLSIISSMKQENVGPDELAGIITQSEMDILAIPQYHEKGAHKGKERGEYTKAVAQQEKLRALLYVYRRYEALMREKFKYDFDDLIVETVTLLQTNESVRLDIQEQYQYILADEHQDVNGAQNEILRLLTSYHDHPNIFVVGDEKQAIYRFQGASLENFLYFESLYKDTVIISLTDNYRSTKEVLDTAHALIAVPCESPLATYRIPLTSNKEGVLPTIESYPHESYEMNAIVNRIRAAVALGVAPEDIAVIVRSNREVESITELLRDSQIPVSPSADSDVLTHTVFVGIMTLLAAVTNPENDTTWATLLLMPCWGMPLGDAVTVLAARSYGESLLSLLANPNRIDDIALTQPDRVTHMMTVIDETRKKAMVAAPHRVLAHLLHASGFLVTIGQEDPVTAARIVRRVYDEVERIVLSGEAVTLADVYKQLSRMVSYGVSLTAPFTDDVTKAVRVMTAHKSKGLEFDTVIIPNVIDTRWGKGNHREYFKVPLTKTAAMTAVLNEDERRLLYVAMTRAKRTLVLSYSTISRDDTPNIPVSFLADIGVQTTGVVCTDMPVTEILPPASTTQTEMLRQLLIRRLNDKGLSATSFNNALENPWNFFFKNVLRFPEAKSLPLQFGTVMHAVLEQTTRLYGQTKTAPDILSVRRMLENALRREPLSEAEYHSLFTAGMKVVESYIPHVCQTLPPQTKEELSIRVAITTDIAEVPTLPLTGMIDRIDSDANGRALQIVDYKTGKPKSRNDIIGKTATSNGNYRRQLTFYALLLRLSEDERYQTTTGTLSFIEPTSKGEIKEETFVTTEEEISDLKMQIMSVVKQLVTGDFLSDRQLLEDSDYAIIGKYFV